MKENREVVQIALEKQTSNKRTTPAKVAVRIKTDSQDILCTMVRVNTLYKLS